MPYWDERVKEMAKNHPGVAVDQYHIDILTAHFVLNPDRFDVVVVSISSATSCPSRPGLRTGTIGIAPSGNINPTGDHPSLFDDSITQLWQNPV